MWCFTSERTCYHQVISLTEFLLCPLHGFNMYEFVLGGCVFQLYELVVFWTLGILFQIFWKKKKFTARLSCSNVDGSRGVKVSYNQRFANNRCVPSPLKFRVRRRETVTFFPAETGRIIDFFYLSHLFSCFGYKHALYIYRETQHFSAIQLPKVSFVGRNGYSLR